MENLNLHFHISRLIVKSFQKELSQQEQNELHRWLENPTNLELYNSLYRNHIQHKTSSTSRPDINLDDNWRKLESRIMFKKRPSIQRWMKYAAILVLPVVFALILLTRQQSLEPSASSSVTAEIPQPGCTKAVLLLTNGQHVDLTQQQELYHPNDSTIILNNQDNTLTIIQAGSNDISQSDYQTIFVPIGGEYKLVLADGTKVWLNSDSRLRFPSTFVGDNRIVDLEGEAYFEVAPNKEKPFIVKTLQMDIEVLGTSFNVNTYNKMRTVTTLTSGKIKAVYNKHKYELEPGYQIRNNTETGKIEVIKVNTDLYTSWKDGYYYFEACKLIDIMETLSRWYNIKVIFQNQYLQNIEFSGYLKRDENVSTLFRKFEKMRDICFTWQGNNVIINRKNNR